jgi:hypothetical protein
VVTPILRPDFEAAGLIETRIPACRFCRGDRARHTWRHQSLGTEDIARFQADNVGAPERYHFGASSTFSVGAAAHQQAGYNRSGDGLEDGGQLLRLHGARVGNKDDVPVADRKLLGEQIRLPIP